MYASSDCGKPWGEIEISTSTLARFRIGSDRFIFREKREEENGGGEIIQWFNSFKTIK